MDDLLFFIEKPLAAIVVVCIIAAVFVLGYALIKISKYSDDEL